MATDTVPAAVPGPPDPPGRAATGEQPGRGFLASMVAAVEPARPTTFDLNPTTGNSQPAADPDGVLDRSAPGVSSASFPGIAEEAAKGSDPAGARHKKSVWKEMLLAAATRWAKGGGTANKRLDLQKAKAQAHQVKESRTTTVTKSGGLPVRNSGGSGAGTNKGTGKSGGGSAGKGPTNGKTPSNSTSNGTGSNGAGRAGSGGSSGSGGGRGSGGGQGSNGPSSSGRKPNSTGPSGSGSGKGTAGPNGSGGGSGKGTDSAGSQKTSKGDGTGSASKGAGGTSGGGTGSGSGTSGGAGKPGAAGKSGKDGTPGKAGTGPDAKESAAKGTDGKPDLTKDQKSGKDDAKANGGSAGQQQAGAERTPLQKSRETGHGDGSAARRVADHVKAYVDGARDGWVDEKTKNADEHDRLDKAHTDQKTKNPGGAPTAAAAIVTDKGDDGVSTDVKPLLVKEIDANTLTLGTDGARGSVSRRELRNFKQYERKLEAKETVLQKIAEACRVLEKQAEEEAKDCQHLVEQAKGVEGGEKLVTTLNKLAESAKNQASEAGELAKTAQRAAEMCKVVLTNIQTRYTPLYKAVVDSDETKPAEMRFYTDKSSYTPAA